MKLKTKFIIQTVIAVTIALANSTVSEWSGRQLDALSVEQTEATEVVQRHMDADMKHDGIRGNVYSALFAAQTNNPALLKSSQDEVNTMSAEFVKEVDQNAAAQTPDDIKQQFEKIKGSVAAYADYSKKLVAEAGNPDHAIAMLPAFNKTFDTLEEDQGKASELILAWSSGLHKRSVEFNLWSAKLKLGLSMANLIMSISILVVAIRGIFRPMNVMIGTMTELSHGKNTIAIPYIERKDEMGEMANSLQVFKENALSMEKMREQQEIQKRATEEQKRAAMRQLAEQFESTVKGVVDMVASAATEMDATSRSVSDVVDGNKEKLTALTGQIAGTSQNVQRVSSATTQLSSAINEISSQVARATTITTSAVEEALKADNTTKGLVDASQKIGEVLEMINSIAAQINLLALNATIEAARAGEAGKGFAVVASEVKNLAAQTTKATEQISSYITSIQGATTDTVSAITSISTKIRDINSIATTIAAAVEEQGVATRDIANNVQQAATSTEEVSNNASEVSAASEQTGNAAHEMTAATGELSRQAEILRSEVDKFLVGIRAA